MTLRLPDPTLRWGGRVAVNGIDGEIGFIIEADKLKNVVHKTRNIANDRYENDAEHSWHACLMALALQGRANFPVDSAHAAAEREAARELLAPLDGATRERLQGLREEFEARGITYEQIIRVNEPKIREGSEQLWRFLRARIDAMREGLGIG